MKASAIDQLIELDDPFNITPAHDELFVAALREAVQWHLQRNVVYRNLAAKRGFRSEQLQSIADVPLVPHVFVNAFKYHELLSVPPDSIVLRLTSSGTTGQKSQICFDQESFDRGLRMVDRVFEAMGLKRPDQLVNYILFAYDPEEAKQVGTAFTDNNLTNLTARGEIYYALRWNPEKGDFEFRPDECYQKLREFSVSHLPVRLLGFPAFLYRLVQHHRSAAGAPLQLGEDSYVLTGGGWKTSETEAIDKELFIEEVSQSLGIPAANIRDGYGLVEHGIAYIECEEHHFHVPAFARAYVREVSSLEVLPDGDIGFLQLVAPFMQSLPNMSILTSDLAVTGRNCRCGRTTSYLELRGRAGIRKNKGCAITAAQLLA